MNTLRYTDKIAKREPWFHLFFWLIVLFFPYLKYAGKEGGYTISLQHDLVALVFDIIPSYVMYLWFFQLKNKKKYILVLILIFISAALLYDYIDGFFHGGPMPIRFSHVISSMIKFVSFSLLFFALHSIKKIYRKQLEFDSINQQKKEAELKALKTQINPHFLFNSLNTIYSSALKKEDKTADMILQLSDNFRYLLIEGQQDTVEFHKEIKHLKGYVGLQKERLEKKIDLVWHEEIDNYDQTIAPLLLIPFVENAFKYTSMLAGNNHKIMVRIVVLKKQLSFESVNPFTEQKNNMDIPWKSSGVGLKNVKERLKLLYGEKHQLMIRVENGLFHVKLEVQL